MAATLPHLVAVACLSSLAGSATRSVRDWQVVQSVGGLALGVPQRGDDGRGHALGSIEIPGT